MAEPVIEREEVVALLFDVSDIAATVSPIERLLEEEDVQARTSVQRR